MRVETAESKKLTKKGCSLHRQRKCLLADKWHIWV